MALKLLLDLGPNLGKGVRTRQPISVHDFDLAGQLAEPAILASGLGVHAGLDGSQFLRSSLAVKAPELPQLRIGDHQTLLVVRNARCLWLARQSGILIVVERRRRQIGSGILTRLRLRPTRRVLVDQ
jgi:hypothetical protein